MVRVTKADLESELKEFKRIAQNFKEEMFKLEAKNRDYLSGNSYVSQEDYDAIIKQFERQTWMYESCKRAYESQKQRNEHLENKIQLLESTENDSNNGSVHKLINERHAGRKPISVELADKIIKLKKDDLSYREIAKTCKTSLGTIHKVINNNAWFVDK